MKPVKLKIDQDTGELIPASIMVPAEKAPAIMIDISDVEKYHKEPEKLLEKIRIQAGYPVFDISKKAGRDACRAHAANIIKTISPAIAASKAMAVEAKKVINQDLNFRRDFENGVREIAAFHRAPLTEYEEEQARIEEEKRLAAQKIDEERLYFLDWDDAIAFNELYDFRKEKESILANKTNQSEKEWFEDAIISAESKNRFDSVKSDLKNILTKYLLIKAVSQYFNVSKDEAEKALFEVFLI